LDVEALRAELAASAGKPWTAEAAQYLIGRILDEYVRLDARFAEVVAEKDEAIEAWGKSEEERTILAARIARVAAIKPTTLADEEPGFSESFVNGWNDALSYVADAIGEHGEAPAAADLNAEMPLHSMDSRPRRDEVSTRDLAVMLDEVLRHVTALPSNMQYRSRLSTDRPNTPANKCSVLPAGDIVITVDPPRGNTGEAFAAGRASVLREIHRRGGTFF
jgi:hypothetical protein